MNEKDIFEKFKKDHNQSFDKSTQEENYLNIINNLPSIKTKKKKFWPYVFAPLVLLITIFIVRPLFFQDKLTNSSQLPITNTNSEETSKTESATIPQYDFVFKGKVLELSKSEEKNHYYKVEIIEVVENPNNYTFNEITLITDVDITLEINQIYEFTTSISDNQNYLITYVKI